MAAVVAGVCLIVSMTVRPRLPAPPTKQGVVSAPSSVEGKSEFWRFTDYRDLRSIETVLLQRSREITPELAGILANVIMQECVRHDLDPALVLAVIATESSFRNWVRSERDARGLMQIQPATGEEVARKIDIDWDGPATLYLPVVNIRVGIYYLKQLLERFDRVEVALAAWNRGPGAVRRILAGGGVPPERFSRKVLAYYEEIRPLLTPMSS